MPWKEILGIIKQVVPVAIPAATGFIGVLVGAWLATRQDRRRLRMEFRAKQLSRFYSPLLGIREEIRILSEIREYVRGEARDIWQDLCRIGRARGDPQAIMKILEPEGEKLKTRIEYDNSQLEQRLLPGYRRMLEHFRDNYWLAKPETRQYFTILVRFVEGWDRFLSGTHSAEVLERLDVNEDDLQPFYAHLREAHDELRGKVERAED